MKKATRRQIVHAQAGQATDYLLNEALGARGAPRGFTTDTDAALGIIEALAAADRTLNFTLDVGMMTTKAVVGKGLAQHRHFKYVASITNLTMHEWAGAETAALAICRVALLALTQHPEFSSKFHSLED